MPPGEDEARRLVAEVRDPELPLLTIGDLGIVRGVSVGPGGKVEVVLTPTYSGCPAMSHMAAEVRSSLLGAGFPEVEVRTELAPAWNTDRLGPAVRAKLEAMAITPPRPAGEEAISISLQCPQCSSLRTRELSHFGSTACKSLWRCQDCGEPFEHFKELH